MVTQLSSLMRSEPLFDGTEVVPFGPQQRNGVDVVHNISTGIVGHGTIFRTIFRAN